MFLRLDLMAAAVPLALAELRDAKTTEAKTPIIATTTKSSINVNPPPQTIFYNLF